MDARTDRRIEGRADKWTDGHTHTLQYEIHPVRLEAGVGRGQLSQVSDTSNILLDLILLVK